MDKFELIETVAFLAEVGLFMSAGYWYAMASFWGMATYVLAGIAVALITGYLIKKNDRRKREVRLQ